METKTLTREGGRAARPPAVTSTPAAPLLPAGSVVGPITAGAAAKLRTGARA